ncbi:aldehyde dehydrogenase family protein [Paracoccus saliphilus]|uniref:Aldehyde dehydrogenase family protein n=1 Tax=Paracoccus saliphilus TaxID=405559 RepID=A0AA45W2S9_9RHOB|nr:aldehyde dehydrogenase family protein [Paracoccus saliphilus]WCR05082.1 aldehyde dehydrogenase family protein [Paracoccus saliphilus]SIS70321.1 betaine-aldehyde dehydrogenase [Paracoccus saliphilus]
MRDQIYIDGRYVASASGEMFDVIDPSNREVFHRVPAGNAEDIDRAVRAARRAFDAGPWPRMSGVERAAVLRKMGDEIAARISEIARIEVQDNGKPLPEAVWDIEDTAGVFHYYADLAERFDQEAEQKVELGMEGFSSKAVKEPVGVAGAIIPWNFPLLMAAWKVAPALAAGCTVVLKPSELTPVSALELGGIAERAGLPAGCLNIITGFGSDAGAPLTEHPLVDKLAFTGSVPTGSRIMAMAAKDIKTLSLELGGKSPLVIFADTPIEDAVEWILFGIFWNQGEVCSATSRVLIEERAFEALMERLVAEAQKIRIGHGLEDGVLLGPLVSPVQHEKVLNWIETGKKEARLVTGGGVPPGLEGGCYVEPTIFADVPEEATIWTEEIFGPVVCVKTFRTEEEAIRLANNTRFGLAAAVMSDDLDRANRVARAFRAGIVWINCSQPTFTEAPWGGYKQSGLGRELGEWGLNNYLEVKQVTTWDRHRPWGWYLKE